MSLSGTCTTPFVGFWATAATALTCSCNIPMYVYAAKAALPWLVPIAKGVVSFPIVYHYVAGIRHLVRAQLFIPRPV